MYRLHRHRYWGIEKLYRLHDLHWDRIFFISDTSLPLLKQKFDDYIVTVTEGAAATVAETTKEAATGAANQWGATAMGTAATEGAATAAKAIWASAGAPEAAGVAA